MGFATNALGMAALVPRGALVLSDENNHASLILGLRVAGAAVRVFRHNDVRHLEQLARAAVAEGHWTKIVVVSATFYRGDGVCSQPSARIKRYNSVILALIFFFLKWYLLYRIN